MSTDHLESQLRRLHDSGQPIPSRTEAAEAKLLAQFDAAQPTRTRGWGRLPKLAVAGLGAGLLVGACALPAELELDLGVGLHLEFDAERELPVHAIAEYCKNELGANDITVEMSISKQQDASGAVASRGSMHLELWGPQLDPDAVVPALQAEFTQLAPLAIGVERLEGSVRTNLGNKMLHEYFDSDRFLNEADLEVARAEVLADLRSRGLQGQVDVEVERTDDGKGLKIGVRQIVEAGDTEGAGELPHGVLVEPQYERDQEVDEVEEVRLELERDGD